MKLTRNYLLKIYGNFGKIEDLRYSASRYKLYTQYFVTQMFYKPWIRSYSTKGMGSLANQAQREASGIVRGLRQKNKSDTPQSDCPQINFDSCPGSIEKSKDTKYDYWVGLNSQFRNKVKIPVKSHRKFNQALREGWKLSSYCKFFKKDDIWFVKAFVTKEVEKAKPKDKFLGVDVGITHGTTRSDGYLGKNLGKIINKEKKSQAERQRQKHKKKNFKTKVKQVLDHDIHLALRRSEKDGLNLVLEDPKVPANLKIGKNDRWARCYYANRSIIRAKEMGIFTIRIHPAYTSITCSSCGHLDKHSRVNQSNFVCTGCGNMVNADLNAAINIARKGQEKLAWISRLTAKVPVNTKSEEKV